MSTEICELNSNDVGDAFGTSRSSHRSMPVARMPVDRYAAEYNMRHPNRGVALIFNHEFFHIPSLKQRAGTNVDCENLRNSFKRLQFDVTVCKDFTLTEIQQKIIEVSRMDHSDNDCLLITILSHGELGYIYAKDVQYKLDSLWQHFTANHCPSLAGKPKLFFIQACQGDQLDGGVMLTRQVTETDGESSMSYKIPIHADFLIAYSTIPGFYSWRNTTKGSWFIQALIQELDRNGSKYNILTLLTFVCQRVALDYESNTPDYQVMHQQKQIPCITTMLTRLLTFTEKQ